MLRPGQQAWEAGRRDTGPGGSLAAEAVRGGCGSGLWQRGVRGEAGGRREGSLLEGTGTAPAGPGKGCETLQMTSQGQSHTTSTFQGVWWKVRLALGVHVRVLHAGQRFAIPAPAADAPCSPIAPRKMPRACIPKWPRGASPPHFTHHLLPLTPKSSSVKCDSCTDSHGGTAQGTAARRPRRAPSSPPSASPAPP